MILQRFRRASHIKLVFAVAAFMATAIPAETVSADLSGGDIEFREAGRVDSVFGAYMAAGHAERENAFDRAAALLTRVLEAQPDDPLLQRRTMLANLHAGQIERAIALAGPQIAIYPSELDIAGLTLAVDAVRRGEYDLALERLAPARRIALATYAGPFLSAWITLETEGADAAVEILSELREDGPGQALHDFQAALIFAAAERFEEAEAILNPYVERPDEANVAHLRLMARVKLGLGVPEAARSMLETFAAIDPENDVIRADLDALNAGTGLAPMADGAASGSSEALTLLSRQAAARRAPLIALRYARLAVYLNPDNALARNLVGALLSDLSQYQQAISVLREVPDASPLKWTAQMTAAKALISLELDEEAIALLESMTADRPDDISALHELGYLMRLRGRFSDGTDYYDRAMARVETVEPRHWTLFYFRGITLERTGRWDEAEADFKQALELEPGQPSVLNYLGYSWIDQGVHIEEGMEMIREAVEARPNDGNIVDSLGWAYYRLGNYEAAVLQLERAVQLEPQQPVILDHLGDAYWKVGRRLEARYQWRQALDMEPDEALRAIIERKLEVGLDAVDAAQADTAD